MDIKQYKEGQREQFRAWQDRRGFERIALVDKNITEYTRPDQTTYQCKGMTLYAEENGEIQGIITRHDNSYHPKFDHLVFAIDRDNQALMLQLMKALRQQSPLECAPLQMTLAAKIKNQWRWFLEQYGFHDTLISEFAEIDVCASLAQLSPPRLPDGYRMLSYNQLNTSESAALATFRRQGYVNTHQWSPPTSLDNPIWTGTDLTASESDNSLVILRGSSVLACSDLGDYEGDYALGWGWTCDALVLADKVALWRAILFAQLTFCQRVNKKCFGEFDSTDFDGALKRQQLIEAIPERFYILQQAAS